MNTLIVLQYYLLRYITNYLYIYKKCSITQFNGLQTTSPDSHFPKVNGQLGYSPRNEKYKYMDG
jgi:hypothetical protein